MATKHADIDRYLGDLPADSRETLGQLRRTIHRLVPTVAESMSYGMPAFKYRGKPLIYLAAWKKHCSLHGVDVEAHAELLKGYDATNGTLRFSPVDGLPASLFETLIAHRLSQIDAMRGPHE